MICAHDVLRWVIIQVGLTENFPVFFGRRDSLTASREEANLRLPSPRLNYEQLKANFAFWGLNEVDLIALSGIFLLLSCSPHSHGVSIAKDYSQSKYISLAETTSIPTYPFFLLWFLGAHTFGRVRCGVVRLFLDNTDTNANFRKNLTKACPVNGNPLKLNNLDSITPDQFDNVYYRNLERGQSLMGSDQTLWSTPGPNQAIVKDFARNQGNFFRQYALSSIKMGNLKPLTGEQGEIRTNCRAVNSGPAVAFQ